MEFLGKHISGPFTVPSGIWATATPIIEYIFRHVPQIGVMTTKSIGPEPRAGYLEPIISEYGPGCYINAVGLTNPGAAAAADALAELEVPADRFLLVSIFGGSVGEFVDVARTLAPHADGLELNLSCPHAKGYGMAMGQDPDLVEEITREIKAAVDVPVIPKLSPNVPDIPAIAAAAVAGGADGLCAINTVGPGYHASHGHPVLSNENGGLSGKAILPIGLKCVREIAGTTGIPIIGCGGASSAADVRAYREAGATIVGVGSALTGLDSRQIAHYFSQLDADLAEGGDRAESLVRYDVDMRFRPARLVDKELIAEGLAILTFDTREEIRAGEFIFVWLPGVGEKPFSILLDDPFKLAVIKVGRFTDALLQLEPGAEVFVRGPYGVPIEPPDGARIVAVAGGTGLAAVYQLARDFGRTDVFFGARTADRLYFLDETRAVADLHVATDDGSEGHHGLVTELLEEHLSQLGVSERERLVFYNCGPAPMVHAAEAVERAFVPPARIYSAIDYLTKCGVGLCGACHAPDGRRLCVDGPFLSASEES